MRRRRFKPKVAWLPVLGRDAGVEGVDPIYGGSATLVCDLQTISWDAQGVTFDTQQSAEEVQQSQTLGVFNQTLADIVSGNSYRLRRIVGKSFCLVASATGTTQDSSRIPLVEVGMGFIVCKTDDDGVPTTDFNYVNPLRQDSAEDPWIWHRRWLLGTTPGQNIWQNQLSNTFGIYNNDVPTSNIGYGSAADGPHIDQKTARIISPSERLFCVVAGKALDPASLPNAADEAISVQFYWHARLVASLRRAGGNRRNASR